MTDRQQQQPQQKHRKPPILGKSLACETFKEGALFKQAGNFSMMLDSCAPNLFSNKHMIRNSINQAKFPNPKQPFSLGNDYSLLDTPNGVNPEYQDKRRSNQSINMRVVDVQNSAPQKSVAQSLVFNRSNNQSMQNDPILSGSRKIADPLLQIVPNKSKRTLSMGGNSLNLSYRQSQDPYNYTLSKDSAMKTKFKMQKTFEGADNKSQMSNFSRLFETKSQYSPAGKSLGGSYANISHMLKQNNQQLLQYTLDSREQYLKNRNHRPSQLNSPIDTVDLYQGTVKDFDNIQSKDMHQTVGNLKLMKNTQTQQFVEPHDKRGIKKHEGADMINQSWKVRHESLNNGRTRYITEFREQEHRAHYSPEYKQRVDQFPNLFAKKKTEFAKISNSTPATSLIIKSNFTIRR